MAQEKREYVVYRDLGNGLQKRIGTTMAVSERQAINNVWYRNFAARNKAEAAKIRHELFAEELILVKR
jgi:hypothetical protein